MAVGVSDDEGALVLRHQWVREAVQIEEMNSPIVPQAGHIGGDGGWLAVVGGVGGGLEVGDEEQDHHRAVGNVLRGRITGVGRVLGAQERVAVEGGAHAEIMLPSGGVGFGAALLDALRDGASPVGGEAVKHEVAVFVRGGADHGHGNSADVLSPTHSMEMVWVGDMLQ